MQTFAPSEYQLDNDFICNTVQYYAKQKYPDGVDYSVGKLL